MERVCSCREGIIEKGYRDHLQLACREHQAGTAHKRGDRQSFPHRSPAQNEPCHVDACGMRAGGGSTS
eukprot:scaffold5925_cov122-Isochrysis_galbana.AAC.2